MKRKKVDYKVYVKDKNTGRKVQEHAFKLGYGWDGGSGHCS